MHLTGTVWFAAGYTKILVNGDCHGHPQVVEAGHESRSHRRHLNSLKVPPRKAARWSQPTVGFIIKREFQKASLAKPSQATLSANESSSVQSPLVANASMSRGNHSQCGGKPMGGWKFGNTIDGAQPNFSWYKWQWRISHWCRTI